MAKNLKVLMIGSDRKLFEDGSAVSRRIAGFGSIVDELHIVVFSLLSLGFKEKELAPNVRVYPTNSFSKWLYVRDAARLGKKIAKEKKFVAGSSVITAQDPFESGLVALMVKKECGLPLELQMHIDPTFSDGYDGFLDRLRKILAQRIVHSADSVRAVERFIEERIRRIFHFAGKVNVLPVFIDKEKFDNSAPDFDLHDRFGWRFVILSVARLTPQKDLPTALKTLALVQEKFPDAGLVIVGAGKDGRKLKKLAKSLGLEKNTVFAGWQNDMASYYKTANVFLQTSLFEGYGMALVEAGLSELPVVTTPVGIATELEHGRDAYICEPGDPKPFAAGIMDLIENDVRRENMRINLKRTLESKLLSKEGYLAELKKNWEEVAKKAL